MENYISDTLNKIIIIDNEFERDLLKIQNELKIYYNENKIIYLNIMIDIKRELRRINKHFINDIYLNDIKYIFEINL